MAKRAVSVTLDAGNLLWLKSRTLARKGRSVSDTLDALISEARKSGPFGVDARSVIGTVDLPADDPDLTGADQHIAALFGDVPVFHRPPVAKNRDLWKTGTSPKKTSPKEKPRRG
jgi:hypothetical protein